MRIERLDSDTKARYLATLEGSAEAAELSLSKVTDSLVIADHTHVPDSMRGLGVGAALFERLIADARAHGQRIVPLCPFVRAQAAKRRDELADVVQW